MSKARDLADFVSDGNPLADGTISVSEVSGAAPTASPTFTGTVNVDGVAQIRGVTVEDSSGTTKGYVQGDTDGLLIASDGSNNITFDVNASERARIDSSGNLLVANTSASSSDTGHIFAPTGVAFHVRDGGIPLVVDRQTNDGDLQLFRKDGTIKGSIGTSTNTEITFAGLDAGIGIIDHAVVPTQGDGLLYRNNDEVDLGRSDTKWKDLYLSGGILADGISTVSTIRENVTTDSTTSGTLNISLLGTSVRYLTANQTANRTLNFRGDVSTSLNSVMAVGESITTAVLATQGTTAYYFNTIQIDTTGVTPKWQGGSAPTGGNASGIDSYSFTIIKTADATFTVLASQTQFA